MALSKSSMELQVCIARRAGQNGDERAAVCLLAHVYMYSAALMYCSVQHSSGRGAPRRSIVRVQFKIWVAQGGGVRLCCARTQSRSRMRRFNLLERLSPPSLA